MLVQGVHQVVQHGVVHLIHPAGDGLQQSAPPDDGIEAEGYAVRLQLIEHKRLAELKLVDDAGIPRQFVHPVADGAHQHRVLVFIHGNLGGGRTGVDGKYLHKY